MNTAKKVGLYFILCSVFNSEVSFENLMLCAMKFFRKGFHYIISFTNTKKCSKFAWKSSDFIAKSAKFRAFQKRLRKKNGHFFMIIGIIPKGYYCSFLCFLSTMNVCIINLWGYTEILPSHVLKFRRNQTKNTPLVISSCRASEKKVPLIGSLQSNIRNRTNQSPRRSGVHVCQTNNG